MKKTILIGLLTTLMVILVCGQTDNGVKTLNENGYSIQYPDSWDLDKSGQMGTSFILFSKPSSAIDQFRENVNLIVQDLSGKNINLDKYVEISEGQIKTMITNGNIISSKRLKSNGIEFQNVIFTGNQGNYNLKFEQYYWVSKQRAYVLTLTCEVNEFENYKTTAEKILNSFRLN
jgi:hypothetical protein